MAGTASKSECKLKMCNLQSLPCSAASGPYTVFTSILRFTMNRRFAYLRIVPALVVFLFATSSVLCGGEQGAGGAPAQRVAEQGIALRASGMQRTEVSVGTRRLPIAPLGPSNPWPNFRFQHAPAPVSFGPGLSDEDRAGALADGVVPPLPYLIQDNYTRQRRSGSVPTIRVENAALRATFYPALCGRMTSLYDKRGGRELLFDNPVLQFANLAIRNAWFSGGVEWNGPLFGHSLLTCSPIYAGLVETSSTRFAGASPLLRLYEFDRALETTWQVDLFLPPADDRLWVHVKAINPNDHEVRFYWWTNIAVPQTSGTRVLAPADYALSDGDLRISRQSFPLFPRQRAGSTAQGAGNGAQGAGSPFPTFDASYPQKYPYCAAAFFRKPGVNKPWLVCLDDQGRGLSHVSTPTLFGRKLFTWGTSRGGQHWLDFLSEPGRGNYCEVQGGVVPTQLQTRPLAAGASIEWTECISPFSMDPKEAHDTDYAVACAAARKAVDQRVSDAALKEMDSFLTAEAVAPIRTLLYRGAGWGWLYEKRIGHKISPGLTFESRSGDEEQPWNELLATGTFSSQTLSKRPCSFNVSPGWTKLLQESARRHGETWLHHLHLGVADLERGSLAAAGEHFRASVALEDNAQARRCLALLHEHDSDRAGAEADYLRAWSLCGNDRNLAVEIAEFLVKHKRYAAFDAFVAALPPPVAGHERIALAQARIALERGQFELVRRLVQREYATIREAEHTLSDLWFASYTREAEARAGRKLTSDEREKLMQKFLPPAEIDFRVR
jgi:hypothetical protein